MNKLKAAWAKLVDRYTAAPKWLVALVAAFAGFVLGRIG